MKTKIIVLVLTISMFFACSSDSNGGSSSPTPNQTSGTYTTLGVTYTGVCGAVPSVAGCASAIDVQIPIPPTFVKSFAIYNMPQASSGTFTFTDGIDSVQSCNLYAINADGKYTLVSQTGGSLTKTGARSFTFTCTVYDFVEDITGIAPRVVTGSGSY